MDPTSGIAPRPMGYTGGTEAPAPAPAPAAGGTSGATVIDSTPLVGSGNSTTGTGGTRGTGNTGTDGMRTPPKDGPSDREVQAKLAQNMAVGEAGANADIFSMMALFQKLAQEMRSAAKEDRQAQMTSQVTQLQGAAQEIRDAAQDRFVGAVVSGALQIGAGAVQLGAGMMATRELGKGMSAANKAEAGMTAPTATGSAATGSPASVTGATAAPPPSALGRGPVEIEMTSLPARTPATSAPAPTVAPPPAAPAPAAAPTREAIAQVRADAAKGFDAQAAKYQGNAQIYSQASGGVGTIVSAFQEKSAAGHDAKKAELEAAAKVSEAGVQAANDMAEKMMDIIRDVRDKLGSMQQAQVETNRSIARNV